MWTILGLIILGLIAGVIAKAVMPGKDPGGMIITILLGIAGSFLGGWLIGEKLLGYGARGTEEGPGIIMNLVLAVVGAVILLAVYRLIKGRSMRV
ncbi:MAG TPA: GlsB/YeaQ/YmgE family stress response membrane protein [Pyrinomonadaceae bacterium]|nr:GlsB/YeaQ/YmgE family stress response membrane protein [Pyrinomonadaceae bacterium]